MERFDRLLNEFPFIRCQGVLVEMSADCCLRTQSDVVAYVSELDHRKINEDVREVIQDKFCHWFLKISKDPSAFEQHVHACAKLVTEIASLFPTNVVPNVLDVFESRCLTFINNVPALLQEEGGTRFVSLSPQRPSIQFARNLTALATIVARWGKEGDFEILTYISFEPKGWPTWRYLCVVLMLVV